MILVICTALNLFGMAYLFYSNSKQREVNMEFLNNASIVNVINLMVKSKMEELEDRVKELESKLKTEKQ